MLRGKLSLDSDPDSFPGFSFFLASTFAVLSEGRLHCNKLSMVKPIGQNEYDYCTVGRTGSLYFN